MHRAYHVDLDVNLNLNATVELDVILRG